MAKQLSFNLKAIESLLNGIRPLAKAVGATLGPLANNVALEKDWGAPQVIHDGVMVAKDIDLPDKFENMGAQLVKEAASKTNDVSGDGTTTSIVLAHQLVEKGFDLIRGERRFFIFRSPGSNAMRLRRGIYRATNHLVGQIKKHSKTLAKNQIAQLATISAQDPIIGKLVGDAFTKLGKDGVITVEEGGGLSIAVDYRVGMQFDRGFDTPYFVTNETRMEADLVNPYILVTDKDINAVPDLYIFLERFLRGAQSDDDKSLVIIANAVEGEALAFLVLNKLKGNAKILAIKAPGFGSIKREYLDDIAVLTGAKVISKDTWAKLDSVTIEDLGRAKRVISTQDSTVIIGGLGDKETIADRVVQLRAQIKQKKSAFEKEGLTKRLAKLTTGVAIINVGAMTEAEMKEKLERVRDAVAATRSALDEGILPGGATTYIHLAKTLDDITDKEPDVQKGIDLVKSILAEPFKLLMENSGLDFEEKYQAIQEAGWGFGVDVNDGKVKQMIKAGIIDPTKVSRSALENAVSIAGVILTTKVLIANKPEPKQKGYAEETADAL